MIAEQVVRDVEAIVPGRAGLSKQFHPCLIGVASALAPVTGNAGAYHVLPGVRTSPPPRYDMVQCKLFALLTTVLASVLIATEHLISA